MSQQKTYSSSSEKKTTSEEETDTPCTISTTEEGTLEGGKGRGVMVDFKSLIIPDNWIFLWGAIFCEFLQLCLHRKK